MLISVLAFSNQLHSQDIEIQGYIISLSDEKITLDLSSDQVSKGDLLKVVKPGEVIIHPVTGEKIQKNDEMVSNITITEVADSYSVGEAYPPESFGKLTVGMKVYVINESEVDEAIISKYVVIPPMNIVGGPKGQLGMYMSDLLTEELFKLDRFRILDRETFDLQQFELGLKKDGQVTKTTGVDYLVVGSAFPPDVVVKSTGVPLKGIVTAATGGQGAIITYWDAFSSAVCDAFPVIVFLKSVAPPFKVIPPKTPLSSFTWLLPSAFAISLQIKITSPVDTSITLSVYFTKATSS